MWTTDMTFKVMWLHVNNRWVHQWEFSMDSDDEVVKEKFTQTTKTNNNMA